jgi:hypothetical protein
MMDARRIYSRASDDPSETSIKNVSAARSVSETTHRAISTLGGSYRFRCFSLAFGARYTVPARGATATPLGALMTDCRGPAPAALFNLPFGEIGHD